MNQWKISVELNENKLNQIKLIIAWKCIVHRVEVSGANPINIFEVGTLKTGQIKARTSQLIWVVLLTKKSYVGVCNPHKNISLEGNRGHGLR